MLILCRRRIHGCHRPAAHSAGVVAIIVAGCALMLSTGVDRSHAQADNAKSIDYGDFIDRFRAVADAEIRRGLLTGVSVAWVDDQRTVFADGFGLADEQTKTPAAADTVYRAGSISKLFTALSAMQLVEQGKLDLDAPITAYDPRFRIQDPFPDAEPVTPRMLMCHRSGMVRESPVGSYFDPAEPTAAETVASIAPCALVYRPGAKMQYSNVGPTIVGHIVAGVSGEEFVDYQHRHLLGPLGMDSSSFAVARVPRDRLATGYMRVADGRGGFERQAAPLFQLGTLPAGNLFATAEDLARFAQMLLAAGRARDQTIVGRDALAQMWRPQLIDDDVGFGLGFYVGRYRGHRTVSHRGAVYGHSTSIVVLSEKKIAVVVLANEDITSGPVLKLSEASLDLMLEAKFALPSPAGPQPVEIDAEALAGFAGDYESESYWARIEVNEGRLTADVSGQPVVLTAVGPLEFEADGRWMHRGKVEFTRDESGQVISFRAVGQDFKRVEPDAVADVPRQWRRYLGSYGPGFIPFIVSVRHGHLYGMTENMVDYRLRPLAPSVFSMPPGLYVGEHVVFQADKNGRVHTAVLANMPLGRIEE